MKQTRLYTLGKQERLKSRKQIEFVFKEGKTFSVTLFRVFYAIARKEGEKPTAALQFGVGVSTKHFKKAVDRNRVKRLVREAYRLQKNELKNLLQEKQIRLYLFFVFTEKEMPVYERVFEKTGLALKKLMREIA